jgi:hypothetical protein
MQDTVSGWVRVLVVISELQVEAKKARTFCNKTDRPLLAIDSTARPLCSSPL